MRRFLLGHSAVEIHGHVCIFANPVRLRDLTTGGRDSGRGRLVDTRRTLARFLA